MHCRKTAPEAGCRFQLTRYIGEREHTSVVELVGPDREDVGGQGVKREIPRFLLGQLGGRAACLGRLCI